MISVTVEGVFLLDLNDNARCESSRVGVAAVVPWSPNAFFIWLAAADVSDF